MDSLQRWCRITVLRPDGSVLARLVLEGRGPPDLGAVDVIARQALLATRIGGDITLAEVAPRMRELLDLVGLGSARMLGGMTGQICPCGDSGDSGDGGLTLPALLSQVLVAFTIEADNEFEHRMPHRTTDHGSTPGYAHPPFLVSMVMWANCMRLVPESGIPVAELARRALVTDRTMALVLTRMSGWWGYVVVRADPADTRARPPRSGWLVRPTPAGRRAQGVWGSLLELIELRWRSRFGDDPIDHLRASLEAIVTRLDVDLPDYLPVGGAGLEGTVEVRPGSATCPQPVSGDAPGQPALTALLSKVLMTLALDYQAEPGPSLATCSNVLRVLDKQGVQVRDLPRLTGLARMAVDNSLSSFRRHHLVVVGPDPSGGRFKVAQLTPKGAAARDAHRQRVAGVELGWEARFGREVVSSLRASLEVLVGGPTLAQSPLLAALQPYPDGWRSQVPPPETLPHYPFVSHRGGFPDGS